MHVVPEQMGYQSTLFRLVVYNSGLGGALSHMSHLVNALARLRTCVERYRTDFAHCGSFDVEMNMPSNFSVQRTRVKQRPTLIATCPRAADAEC